MESRTHVVVEWWTRSGIEMRKYFQAYLLNIPDIFAQIPALVGENHGRYSMASFFLAPMVYEIPSHRWDCARVWHHGSATD